MHSNDQVNCISSISAKYRGNVPNIKIWNDRVIISKTPRNEYLDAKIGAGAGENEPQKSRVLGSFFVEPSRPKKLDAPSRQPALAQPWRDWLRTVRWVSCNSSCIRISNLTHIMDASDGHSSDTQGRLSYITDSPLKTATFFVMRQRKSHVIRTMDNQFVRIRRVQTLMVYRKILATVTILVLCLFC